MMDFLFFKCESTSYGCVLYVFFFQAEDGIRDHCVTGVQTCALPIWADRDVVDVLVREPRGHPSRLLVPERLQTRIGDAVDVLDPFGQGVTNEYQLHVVGSVGDSCMRGHTVASAPRRPSRRRGQGEDYIDGS